MTNTLGHPVAPLAANAVLTTPHMGVNEALKVKMAQEVRELDAQEEESRARILKKRQKTVVVKIAGAIAGLPEKEHRTAEQKNASHEADARVRGLNPHTYRAKKPDTGYQINKDGEWEVSLMWLIQGLEVQGLHYKSGHIERSVKKGKSTTMSVLTFSSEKSSAKVPESVTRALADFVYRVHIWANPRFLDPEMGAAGGEYRLDTINTVGTRREKPLIQDGLTLLTLVSEHNRHTYEKVTAPVTH